MNLRLALLLLTLALPACHRAPSPEALAAEAATLKPFDAQLRVLQVSPQLGILAGGNVDDHTGADFRSLQDPIFVFCDTAGLADGDSLDTQLFHVGTHRYTTVLGAQKTVRSFARTALDAARRRAAE